MNNHESTQSTANQANDIQQALATVRQLAAAGLVDAATLGLPVTQPADATTRADDPAVTGNLPIWALVPGTPITIRDLVAKTKAGLKKSTLRAYGGYLDVLAEGGTVDQVAFAGYGDRYAHEILPTELEAAVDFVRTRALATAQRRAEVRESVDRVSRSSSGDGAVYNAVGAWRAAFNVAVKDRHLARQFNPAMEIDKPRRLKGRRRPLKTDQMAELWAVVRGTGNDPELDEMLCQTILISGARREGLLNLTLGGIDLEESTIYLIEKFGKKVWQPVPDWFAQTLHDFAVARGAATRGDQVFRLQRYADGSRGQQITSRRLDYLFDRVQSTLTWADREQVTAHTLRHHAIALVERHAGKQVSTAFARHEPEDTNGLYGRASREEVAQAVVDLYGGSHPWLESDHGSEQD